MGLIVLSLEDAPTVERVILAAGADRLITMSDAAFELLPASEALVAGPNHERSQGNDEYKDLTRRTSLRPDLPAGGAARGLGGRRRSRDRGVHVGGRRAPALPGRHLRRRAAGALHRAGSLPARQDLGLRRCRDLGDGRLRRRVRGGPGRAGRPGRASPGAGPGTDPWPSSRRPRRQPWAQRRAAAAPPARGSRTPQRIETWGEFEPGDGFLVGRTSAGELSISAYALVRYMNQLPADQTFTDHLGNERTVDTRQDFFPHRVMVFFKGWLGIPSSSTTSSSGPSTRPTRTPSSRASATSSAGSSASTSASAGCRARARCRARIPTGSATTA